MASNLSFPVFGGPTVGAVISFLPNCGDIAPTLLAIPDFVNLVICVDNTGGQDTRQQLRALADNDLRIHIMPACENLGAGYAAGFRFALDAGADFVIGIADKNSVNLSKLELLIAPIMNGDSDATKGNRFADPYATDEFGLHETARNAFSRVSTRFASGYWDVCDPNIDLIGVHADVIQKMPLDDMAKEPHFFTEMLNHLGLMRAKLIELPIAPITYLTHDAEIAAPAGQVRSGLFRLWSDFRARGIRSAGQIGVLAALSLAFFVLSLPFTLLQNGLLGAVMSPIGLTALLSAFLFRSYLRREVESQPARTIHPYLGLAKPEISNTIDAPISQDDGRQALIEEMILLHSLEKTIH